MNSKKAKKVRRLARRAYNWDFNDFLRQIREMSYWQRIKTALTILGPIASVDFDASGRPRSSAEQRALKRRQRMTLDELISETRAAEAELEKELGA